MLFKPASVNYILRYYLPYELAEQRVGEIIDFCKTTDTGYVMFMCGAQHMAWNMIPVDIVRIETDKLIYARKELGKHGIKIGLNMGVTFGHCQNRWDHRDKFPNITYWKTDSNGHSDHSSPCPEDTNLKEHVKQVYRIYAECNPEYIYIDDDMRFDVSEKSWGCFCAGHLKLFSEITGCQWNSEQLKAALYEDPNTRRQWIEMLGNCIVNWARDLIHAVHEVNPKIAMGMMVPCVHLMPVFGHNLIDVFDALDDGVTPIVRPCIGGYGDNNRRDIVGGIIYMELIRHFLSGRQVEYTPELETAPFTRLSKSMKVVRFQISQAILNGMTNPAITLAGYVGDPVDIEPEYLKSLPMDKPFFDTLCNVTPAPETKRGIQLVYDFDSAKESKLKIKSPLDMGWSSFVSAKVLGSLGICYTLDESAVKLMTGDIFRTMSKERIEEVLSSGLILDAIAADTLVDMGYSNDIGVNIGKEPIGWMAEECTDAEFSGPYTKTYIPLKAVDTAVRLLPTSEDVKVISSIVDADHQHVCHGVILNENSRGGRIAVLPYLITANDGDSRHLLCYQRRFMLRKIVEWMNPKVLPVFVEKPTDFLVQSWDDGEMLTLCLTNLSYDTCEHIKVVLAHKAILQYEKAKFVNDNGAIKVLKVSSVQIENDNRQVWDIEHSCSAFRPLIIRIPYAKKN